MPKIRKYFYPSSDLFFLSCASFFYQNHLVCLQNAFEIIYPESRSPKGSCQILCWLEVYILQNNISPGRLCFGPCACKETTVKCSHMWGRGTRKREREVLAIQVLNCRQRGEGLGTANFCSGGSSRHLPVVEPRALSSLYNVYGMEDSDWSKYVGHCWILQWDEAFHFSLKKLCCQPLKAYSVWELLLI